MALFDLKESVWRMADWISCLMRARHAYLFEASGLLEVCHHVAAAALMNLEILWVLIDRRMALLRLARSC